MPTKKKCAFFTKFSHFPKFYTLSDNYFSSLKFSKSSSSSSSACDSMAYHRSKGDCEGSGGVQVIVGLSVASLVEMGISIVDILLVVGVSSDGGGFCWSCSVVVAGSSLSDSSC